MSRARVNTGARRWPVRVPEPIVARLSATRKLVKIATNQHLTWAQLLNRWAVNAGVQARRRLRQRGIDPESVTGSFKGLPSAGPRPPKRTR